MESKLKKITYLFISLFIALLLNNTLIFKQETQIDYSSPQSADYIEPIYIDGAATGVGAHNWTWAESQSWCFGSGTWNDPYIIENLKINGTGTERGIDIVQSDVRFIIQDCLINNTDTGIYLQDVNNALLINNTCSNLELGMDIDTCNNNTISGNTANGNYNYGISLYECYNNTISGNTANDNNFGIFLSYCDYNNITGNTVNDNGESGIFVEECSNNTILGNTANDNGDSGISLHDYCSNNIISGNTANGNNFNGIYLDYECSNNTISGNTANDNGDYGIKLYEYSDYNDIIDNVFYNNTLGILIDSDCDNNSIYQNFFLENGIHAVDDGTDNNWNSTSIGNYWDNWTSPDVSPNDGIVDDPYTYMGGSAGSIDYLPIAEDGAPSITINSPTSSDVFGVNAPSFDVTITDVYVDSMWYTIDGGITNYTFIENGVINQTAWAALAEGDVTITFYAKDIVGNEASESVTVVKTTAGLDPGIIIVVVSIVGGVVLAAVIYIYLKKRPSPE